MPKILGGTRFDMMMVTQKNFIGRSCWNLFVLLMLQFRIRIIRNLFVDLRRKVLVQKISKLKQRKQKETKLTIIVLVTIGLLLFLY
jgi:hypothetical protein